VRVLLRDEKLVQRLGVRLGRLQDKVLAPEAPDRFQHGYRRFLAAIDREEPKARRHEEVRWAMGVTVAACAAVALWWTSENKSDTISFKVGLKHTPGVVGQWITTSPTQSVPVAFSDGTWIDLEPYTRARIGVREGGARRIILESGSARVRVIHRDSVQWRIDAGPFAVRVTGTAFNIVWIPESQLFEVRLREGAVLVDGPVLDKGRAVGKGQTLRVSVPKAMALLADSRSIPPYRDWIAPLNPVSDEPSDTEGDHREQPQTSVSRTRADTLDARWKELADDGRYEDALAAAEKRGFHRLCRQLGAASLLRLAEVARFAGRVDRAEQALWLLRERFPKRRESAIAAYTLGRSAFDQKGSYGEAAKWFEAYLRQQPSGPLAREALGRLMEAQQRQGRNDSAKQTARRYLDRYPDGPHADIAARLIVK
jgi:transmembrane sensor